MPCLLTFYLKWRVFGSVCAHTEQELLIVCRSVCDTALELPDIAILLCTAGEKPIFVENSSSPHFRARWFSNPYMDAQVGARMVQSYRLIAPNTAPAAPALGHHGAPRGAGGGLIGSVRVVAGSTEMQSPRDRSWTNLGSSTTSSVEINTT